MGRGLSGAGKGKQKMPSHETKADDLKALRRERADWIARAAARVKEQKRDLKGIRQRLGQGPATVPAVAEATGLAADKVLWYLAALKKYGQVVEEGKEGGYYRYALVGGEPDEPGAPPAA